MDTKPVKTLALLASGEGTNAQTLWRYFINNSRAKVWGVACNRSKAGVYARAEGDKVHHIQFAPSPEGFAQLLHTFLQDGVTHVVLAGFLKAIPTEWVNAYPGKIINIHPSLLPKYGGMGMYGMHVHQAVKAAGEKESGITIHTVTAVYDEGPILFQAKTTLAPSDDANAIRQKVQELEYRYFAQVVDHVVSGTPLPE